MDVDVNDAVYFDERWWVVTGKCVNAGVPSLIVVSEYKGTEPQGLLIVPESSVTAIMRGVVNG